MNTIAKNENISLVINCHKENIADIDIQKFKDQYKQIYFNINDDINKIIDIIETDYYSIWDYNKEYKNINNLKEISINKSYIENPDISVIVCLYNTPTELFKGCIDGLVNQTFKNFEVLIVNDGSDKYYEENKQVINQLHDNRFIWINKEHSGKSQTLNLGIEKARGKYIAINDSDDISFQNRLEYQYNWLEENIEYDYICNRMIKSNDCNYPYIGDESVEINKNNIYLCIHGSSLFNKQYILNKLNLLFLQSYNYVEDQLFNLMCINHNVKMYYDSKILMTYVMNLNNNSSHNIALKRFTALSHKIDLYIYNKQFVSDELCIIINTENSYWNLSNLEILLISLKTSITLNNIEIYIYTNNLKYIDLIHIYNCVQFDAATNICQKYVFYIEDPFEIQLQNFDSFILNFYKYKYICNNDIIVPLFNYCGEYLYGLDKQILTDNIIRIVSNQELNKLKYNEYQKFHQINILNNCNFVCATNVFCQLVNNNILLNNVVNKNVILSNFLTTNNSNIYIYNDFICKLNDSYITKNTEHIEYIN